MNKKYLLAIPIMLLMAFGVYATVQYFHQVPVDITVTEARSSGNVAVSLSCLSGESVSDSITIHNSANVDLNALVTWQEIENNNSVTYTIDLPKTVTISAGSNLIVNYQISCSPITEAGIVLGSVNMEKTA